MDGGNNNEQKAAAIRTWIDPKERITVQFDDQHDLNAEVTGCTDQVVSVALETAVPHMRGCEFQQGAERILTFLG